MRIISENPHILTIWNHRERPAQPANYTARRARAELRPTSLSPLDYDLDLLLSLDSTTAEARERASRDAQSSQEG